MKIEVKRTLKALTYIGLAAMVIILIMIASSCSGNPKELPKDTQKMTADEIAAIASEYIPEDQVPADAEHISAVTLEALSVIDISGYLLDYTGQWIVLSDLDYWYDMGITEYGIVYTSNANGQELTIATDIAIKDVVENGANSYYGYLYQEYDDPYMFYVAGGYAVIEDLSAITGDDGMINTTSNDDEDRPGDYSSIYELTSDPLTPEQIDSNMASFFRDYNGKYVVVADVYVMDITSEGVIMCGDCIGDLSLRYPEQVYSITSGSYINIYGKVTENDWVTTRVDFEDVQLLFG